MNHKANSPKLDLKLNLSPPRSNTQVEYSSNRVVSSPSSCVSSELSSDESLRYESSPETKPMMLVGCPQCLMYVMLSEDDPKCPKCKSTFLLEIIHEEIITKKPKD